MAHHFDRGIPWESLIAGEPVPDDLAQELAARRAVSSGQEVYVAPAITNFERDDIPGGLDGAPRPEALQGGAVAKLPDRRDDLITFYRRLYRP